MLHDLFFVIMYIFVYMLFCRGPQGRLVRQLSHSLKIKSLLTYLLTVPFIAILLLLAILLVIYCF